MVEFNVESMTCGEQCVSPKVRVGLSRVRLGDRDAARLLQTYDSCVIFGDCPTTEVADLWSVGSDSVVECGTE